MPPSSLKTQAALAWTLALGIGRTDATSQVHERQSELAFSPPFYPSPWMDPTADGWEDAYAQAKALVSQMTILEKVNLTTGVG